MLPQKNRLLKDRDFKRIYKNAPKIKGAFLSIRYVANKDIPRPRRGKNNSRFGIIVSNKTISKAVERNLIKRRLRQALREHLDKIKSGYDVIIKLERVPPVIRLGKFKEENLSLEIESLLKRSRLAR